MTTLWQMEKEKYGPRTEQVISVLSGLLNIDWFVNAGIPHYRKEAEEAIREWMASFDLKQYHYHIHWLEEGTIVPSLAKMNLAKSPLWRSLFPIPEHMKQAAAVAGREGCLTRLVDEVPVRLFHHCFDAAYRAFHQYGSSVVKTAVCSVMYIGGMACAWESVADLDGWGSNPFRALLRVFEYGHCPLGMGDEQLYLF
ncbi:hypothetical protein [Geobacillus sp. C56-T3]|uniref:hypothetical protein n=1 Tax=Geobacillus sp. (strain C56-T3) TaxID=691437 RepID=UPI0001D5872D|nr:hypothetical protein [Geobacillus sp. C56-T3]ADI27043.1 hypothetical protein GC56T3_2061 [Geobacillus sp. C56-T3]